MLSTPDELTRGALASDHGVAEPWWTPQRARLHSWLATRTDSLAPLYKGGVKMANDESFPGRVTLIAHVIREIRNHLPGALDGEIVSTRPQYRDLVNRIYDIWEEEGSQLTTLNLSYSQTEPSSSGPERYNISRELLSAVEALIVEHEKMGSNSANLDVRLFTAAVGETPIAYARGNWKAAYKWAMKYVHRNDRSTPDAANQEATENFLRFEKTLFALSQRAYTNLDEIDEILDHANA